MVSFQRKTGPDRQQDIYTNVVLQLNSRGWGVASVYYRWDHGLANMIGKYQRDNMLALMALVQDWGMKGS